MTTKHGWPLKLATGLESTLTWLSGSSELRVHKATFRGYARNTATPWGVRTVEITGRPHGDPALPLRKQPIPARLQLSYNGKRYHVPGFLTEEAQTGERVWTFHGNTSYVQTLPRHFLNGRAS